MTNHSGALFICKGYVVAESDPAGNTPVKLLPQYQEKPSVVVFKDNHHELRVMNKPYEVRLGIFPLL
jgi:hypothetical protein